MQILFQIPVWRITICLGPESIVFRLTLSTKYRGIPITQSQHGREVSWRMMENILSILSAMNMQAARIKYAAPLISLPPGEAEPLLPATPSEDG
jgi:hypothetical protein